MPRPALLSLLLALLPSFLSAQSPLDPTLLAGMAARSIGPAGMSGKVTAVEGVEEVRAHPDTLDLEVNVSVGDTVQPLEANWARLGQIVATGADTAAAVAACERLLSKITVTTAPEG